MLRWSVSYAKAEFILASLHNASGDIQKNAFRGRLKHLKRLGIPLNSAPGRGKKIDYFEDDLLQWALCLEFAEFGMDPTTIVRFVETNWVKILPRFKKCGATQTSDDDVFLIAHPNLMSASWDGNEESVAFKWLQLSDSNLFLARLGRSTPRRAIVVNISQLYREMQFARMQFDSVSAKSEV
ncbi:MAG: hypothetical protein H0V72_18205 [Bradyrhizobium sp.]|nr:hypothetical protein [Bradyrhizobium sp.]